MCDPSVRSSTFAHTGLINSWFVCKKNAKWNSKVISSNLFSMNFGKFFGFIGSPSVAHLEKADEKSKQRIQASGRSGS